MKKLTKIAIVAAGAALAVQGAFAANNDLIFTINNNDGGGTNEFTVDLGQQSSFTGPNYDLSSALSAYSSYVYAGAASLNAGVVGGQNGQGGITHPNVGNDDYTTTLRIGGGSYLTAGTENAPTSSQSISLLSNAGGTAGSYSGFGANLNTSDPTSFSQNIANDPSSTGKAANSFVGYLGEGANPLTTMSGTGTITLDLWKDTVTSSSGTSGWTYQGDLTLNLSGASPSLVWDAAPVPEPSTYSLFGGVGFGLLALCLRRKLRRTNV